jgi:signal transduction histidine kinase/ActR/RegA family two-component response regulator
VSVQGTEQGEGERFPLGGGELGALIRAFDWSATPLGPIASWPQSLKTVTNMLLLSPVPIVLLWGERGVMIYNDAYSVFAGGRHPSLLGSEVRKGWPEVADFNDNVMRVGLAGKTLAYRDQELTLHRHGGPEPVWMNLDYSPVLDESGTPAGVVAVVVETTARVLAERRVQASEARLRFLDALGKATASAADADAILATTTRMLGERLGVSVCAYADMDADQDGFTIRGDWAAPGASSIVGRYRLSAFGKLALERLHAGEPLILCDNAAELPPEEARTFLSIGLAATICMPLVKQGRLTALMAIHDSRPREWGDDEKLLLAEVTERSWAHIERVRSEAEVRAGESRFREALEAQVAARTAELQRSEANIRAIFETSHLHQWLLSADGAVQFANATALAAIGRRLDEAKGRPFWDTDWFRFTPGAPETVRQAVLRAGAGAAENFPMTLQTPSGERSFDFSLRPVLNEDGAITGMVPEAVETTARLQAEEALRQAQKLEAIGQLTGGVAHDFNNLLTIIRSAIDFLRRPDLPEERRRRYVEAVSDTADRAAKLTGQLLAFARRQTLKPEVFEAGARLRSLAEMLTPLVGPGIDIRLDLPAESGFVRADVSQFDAALVNMAVNARDAMDGEGVLTVRLALDRPPSPGSELKGRFVTVSLADTGTGIPKQHLSRIFEPFFTTKGVGRGTGLGLSQLFGFAKQSGGDVEVESVVGRGATFRVYLPQVDPDPETLAREAAVAVDQPALPGDGRHILVVEDNVDVGSFANTTLRDLGYVTTWAANAREALARLENGESEFDAVFSDVVMPGMNGLELGQEIRRRYPGLPIVLTSGYSEILAQEGQGDFELLKKPYSIGQLTKVLRAAADRRQRLG